MRTYTTIEQSRILEEHGFDSNKADMCYYSQDIAKLLSGNVIPEVKRNYPSTSGLPEPGVPCWTLMPILMEFRMVLAKKKGLNIPQAESIGKQISIFWDFDSIFNEMIRLLDSLEDVDTNKETVWVRRKI